ncbi:hypothetical protein OCU04_010522 [Sclerotinia nivalis]|uniref:UBA domain-containing protein n=1 Tax=Sclerotinia nivalis TaxID=352851 RepID=A0A9X0ACE1_9HELO|nr:hypothetical protein OCU04_010522 [Sclerotinia nivalis]
MPFLFSPAQPSINQCIPLLKPKLSEIIVHLTFIPPFVSKENDIQHSIDRLLNRIDHARHSNASIEESISASLKIVPRIRKLPPWKFINIELKFEGSENVPTVDETLRKILEEFARDLGIIEGCPVSVGTSQFIPDGSSRVSGLVDHDELLHYIPSPCTLNLCLSRQLDYAKKPNPNAVSCRSAEAEIARLISIGLNLSGVKLREDLHQSSVSEQVSNSSSSSDDSSGFDSQSSSSFDPQSDLNGLSEFFQKQARNTVGASEAVTVETTSSANFSEDGGVPLIPLNLENALDRFEVVEDWAEHVELERQDSQVREKLYPYSLQEENCGSIFEWPWVQTELDGARQRPLPAQSSILEASSELDMEKTTSLVLGSTSSDRTEDNAETKMERSTSTRIENPCGALRETWQVSLLEENFDSSHILGNEADIKQPTSSVLKCLPTHLRGGCIEVKKHYRHCLKRIMKRSLHDHSKRDIDLGHGGSHFSAEPFPKYDPTVDLMYLYETDGIYRVDTYVSPKVVKKRREMLNKAIGLVLGKAIHNIRCYNFSAGSNVELISGQPIHSNRSNSSSIKSNPGYHCDAMSQFDVKLDPGHSNLGTESSYMHLRGGIGDADEHNLNPINTTSTPSRRTRKRDKFRAMVKNPLKFLLGRFFCKKPTQTAQGGDYDEHEEDNNREEPEEIFKEEVGEKGKPRGRLSKRDEYQRVMNDYNLLVEQIIELKTKLREIEEILPEHCDEVQQYRSITKDTTALNNFDQRMMEIDRKKEGTPDVKSSLKLISRACKEANVVKGILHRRRDLARIAWRNLPYVHSESTITLLRGGAGPPKKFRRRCKMGIQEFAKFQSENEPIAGPAPTPSQTVEPATPTQTVVPPTPTQTVVSPNPTQTVESPTPTQTVEPPAERPALQAHQQHDSIDSGISGLEDTESQQKDEPAQNENSVQADESSEPQTQVIVEVVEVGESSGDSDNVEQSDTIENSNNADESNSVEDSDDFEESKSFEGSSSVNETGNVESSDPEEPERFARQRLERAREQLERQAELKDEIADVSAEFNELVREIASKRQAIIGGDPLSKADFESRVTDDDVSDITRYIKYKWDISRILDDTTFYPYQVTRAKNCVIGARRVRDIFDNWYVIVVQRQERSTFDPITLRGLGILDNWDYITPLPETLSSPKLSRKSSVEVAPLPVPQSKAVVEERGESSRSSAPLPFRRAYPVVEERGESSRSNAPVDDWQITAQINELEVKNGIEVTNVSRRSSKDHSNSERDAKITPLSEKVEEEGYQPQIPEECIETLTVLGATRAEAVNILMRTQGDVQRAANIFYEEDPLVNDDAYDLLLNAEADINGVMALTGVSPREAFIALLVSGDDIGKAVVYLSADSTHDGDDKVAEASNDNKVVGGGKRKEIV